MTLGAGGRAAESVQTLVQALSGGDRSAIATALNLVEDRRPDARTKAAAMLAALPAERLIAHGHLIGLTGPPGVGKSSLAAALIREWRGAGRRVAVLAVDPSSPLSGGALLGDRLRMLQPQPDEHVFIRSLAGRGSLGGLSAEVFPMSQVLLAAFDVVLVETIGVGQAEIDVATHTDSTCLLAQPASGDMIQYLKAGILELPAVVAVNKADMGQVARRAAEELSVCLPGQRADCWQVPVLLVSAKTGQGIAEMVQTLEAHRAWLGQSKRLEDGRRDQAVAWGLKRLHLEFGSYGIDLLGGAVAVRKSWRQSDRSAVEFFQALHQRCLARLSQPKRGRTIERSEKDQG